MTTAQRREAETGVGGCTDPPPPRTRSGSPKDLTKRTASPWPLVVTLKQPSRSPVSESAPHCSTTAPGRYTSITCARACACIRTHAHAAAHCRNNDAKVQAAWRARLEKVVKRSNEQADIQKIETRDMRSGKSIGAQGILAVAAQHKVSFGARLALPAHSPPPRPGARLASPCVAMPCRAAARRTCLLDDWFEDGEEALVVDAVVEREVDRVVLALARAHVLHVARPGEEIACSADKESKGKERKGNKQGGRIRMHMCTKGVSIRWPQVHDRSRR